jgi:hypothetical protein
VVAPAEAAPAPTEAQSGTPPEAPPPDPPAGAVTGCPHGDSLSPSPPAAAPPDPAPAPTPATSPYTRGRYRLAKPPAPPPPPPAPPPLPPEEALPSSVYRAAAGKTQHGRWSDGDRYADLLTLAVIAPATPWEPLRFQAAEQVAERARGLADQLPEVVLLRQHRERSRAAAQAVETARIARDETNIERRRILNATPCAEDLVRLDEIAHTLVEQEKHLAALERSAAEYQRGEPELLEAARRTLSRLAAEQAMQVRAKTDRLAEVALARAAAAAGDHLVEWLKHHRCLIEFGNVEGLAAQTLLAAVLADGTPQA